MQQWHILSLGYGFHNPCVICEAANDTVRNAEGDVVDKDKKQDGTKNCSLWDTTND